ncbi:1-acylglycerol-3-phosphate O-acyltransferase [Lentibacillus sp. JNUCC-1]|uniref:lysophospholipid acyltransferase family protein n=1 Tax=Lentibacillus sp. JNUCC-1 TaxID=2654513 RepID=UPI001322AEB6|nr:lysophospholipid acyltransferase family protein [Lentibacillus sp. JNUCC-1]MUV38667.1 1-acylglycerol-3-phosphate O-acyltransferase [Lentibacillus sp. JNUCC-1]
MLLSIRVYLYAGWLVLTSWFKLPKARQLYQKNGLYAEEIFETPKAISRKVLAKTGTRVEVSGVSGIPEGPVLFVANHQGLFDILAFLGFLDRPVGFIAKQEIKRLPVIPQWMDLIHCVFINRKDTRQSVKAIQQGTANLKEGHSMVVFPEGTRSRSHRLNDFKPGSLRLAVKAGCPLCLLQ